MPAIFVAIMLSNGAVEALRTLAPSVAVQGLGIDSAAAAVIIMGYSTGAFVGLLGFGWVSRRLVGPALLAVAFCLQALGTLGVAASENLAVTVLAAGPIGVGFSLTIPLLSAALQGMAPDDLRGRVMSVFAIAHLGMRPFFALAAGGAASLLGSRSAMVLFTIGSLAAAVFVLRQRVGAGDRDGG